MSLGGYPGGLNTNSFQSFASTSGFGKQLASKVVQPSPAFKTKMLELLKSDARVNNVVRSTAGRPHGHKHKHRHRRSKHATGSIWSQSAVRLGCSWAGALAHDQRHLLFPFRTCAF
jgi:hypothetical protein